MKSATGTIICRNCGAETEAEFTTGRPAKTYGPPENCYPEEPGEYRLNSETDGCSSCGHEFTDSEISSARESAFEAAADRHAGDAEDKAEMEADR